MTTEYRSARDRLDRIAILLRRAMRFWNIALLTLVVGSAAALALAVLRPRIYKSETLILYRVAISSDTLGTATEGGDPARKLGLKLKEMVLSRTQLQQVIDEFRLFPQIVDERGYVDAVDELRKRISFRVKDGDTFGLSYEGEDPKQVQAVTARLAQILLEQNSRTREEQAFVTREFLEEEQKRVDGELQEKETALAQFLAKHPEFAKETALSAGNVAGTAIRAQEKQQGTSTPMESNLLALEREAARIRQRLGMPQPRKPRGEYDPRVVADRQAAEADVVAAQKELGEKLGQFTEQHPDVRAAKQKLRAAQDRLRRAQDAVVSTPLRFDTSAEEPTIDKATLERELNKVLGDIGAYRKKMAERSPGPVPDGAAKVVALETDWTRLNREVTEAREHNQQLQDKQFKATMQESAASSQRNAQMVVVDPAYKPTHPAKPGRAVIAGAGVGASLLFALLLALSCALLDDRLYDRDDVERLQLTSFLGVVPAPAAKLKEDSRG